MSGARVRNRSVGNVRGVFLFALLAAFALLSVMTVIMGAQVYGRISDRAAANHGTRTALTYIAGKVRSFDQSDAVRVETPENRDVLVLSGVYGGDVYHTYIYLEDGAIREYFGAAERAFDPAMGERIADAASFAAELTGGTLRVRIGAADGKTHETQVFLQSVSEAAA